MSTVREEARINRHRDTQPNNTYEDNDDLMQVPNHLMQTQRMNFQEHPQEGTRLPIATNNSEIDLNLLRGLNPAGDNGRLLLSQLPPPSSLLDHANSVYPQLTTEP